MPWDVAQTTLDVFLDRAGLREYLKSLRENYTLFAPQNIAWDAAFYKENLDCTTDFYVTSACTSKEDLMTATNLRELLMNHGVFQPSCLTTKQNMPDVPAW